jgi:DNA-binding transcriptional MerR regulator
MGEELPKINTEGLTLPSVMEIKNGVLDIRDVPPSAAIVIGLRSLGFSLGQIAKIVKTSKTNVQKYCERYDPNGLCKISDKDKRLITSQMLTTTSMAALMEISKEKLEDSTAKDLAMIASKCAETAEKLQTNDREKKREQLSRIESMMNIIEDAEIIEE